MKPVMTLIRTAALVLGFAVAAGTTAAKPGLGQEPGITEGLIATAIAYEIGERCDSLNARILTGIRYLYRLRGHARDLGYSEAEIEAFIDDRSEQDRLEAIARGRLRELGGIEGQWQTYCDVGRAQIAAGSRIGLLLR